MLRVGPPGTGKTLLARAMAGEAGVSFLSANGAEFVEMFVGVGAARMAGVATMRKNRPEILDPALLRAGRFDRQVLVDRPDLKGRLDVLKVHVRKVRVAAGADLEAVAAMTPGFAGADLANLVNEAALLATRRGAEAVVLEDFTAAIERIVAGLEKKSRLLGPQERQTVACHEMGHALVAMALPGTDPVQKVSIIPRGVAALGYTLQRPTEDRFLLSREEINGKITVLLAGRALVRRYGMSEALGLVSWEPGHRHAGSRHETTARDRDPVRPGTGCVPGRNARDSAEPALRPRQTAQVGPEPPRGEHADSGEHPGGHRETEEAPVDLRALAAPGENLPDHGQQRKDIEHVIECRPAGWHRAFRQALDVDVPPRHVAGKRSSGQQQNRVSATRTGVARTVQRRHQEH